MISGVITGLVAFIAVRVITGLGEGAFYSNDRSLIAQQTPREKRSLGMGVVITGLAFGITIATVFAPNLIDLGARACSPRTRPGGCRSWSSAPRRWSSASRSRSTSAARSGACRTLRATLHLMAFSAVGLAAVMAVYFVGDAAGLSDLWIAVLEVALALTLVGFVFTRRNTDVGVVLQVARPGADQPRVHRGAVEPVVLQLLVGLDRRRRRGLVASGAAR